MYGGKGDLTMGMMHLKGGSRSGNRKRRIKKEGKAIQDGGAANKEATAHYSEIYNCE